MQTTMEYLDEQRRLEPPEEKKRTEDVTEDMTDDWVSNMPMDKFNDLMMSYFEQNQEQVLSWAEEQYHDEICEWHDETSGSWDEQ